MPAVDLPSTRFSGQALRRQRQAAGFTREQLAVAVARSVSSIAAWEQGKVTPGADSLGRVAAVLGCSTDELFAAEADRAAA